MKQPTAQVSAHKFDANVIVWKFNWCLPSLEGNSLVECKIATFDIYSKPFALVFTWVWESAFKITRMCKPSSSLSTIATEKLTEW